MPQQFLTVSLAVLPTITTEVNRDDLSNDGLITVTCSIQRINPALNKLTDFQLEWYDIWDHPQFISTNGDGTYTYSISVTKGSKDTSRGSEIRCKAVGWFGVVTENKSYIPSELSFLTAVIYPYPLKRNQYEHTLTDLHETLLF